MKKVLSLVCCLVFVLFLAVGCKRNEEKIIKVGASPSPHAGILEQCREYVESKGYELEIVEFSDYILPNVGVQEGSLDANFFQHQPYLDDYNVNNRTNLVSVLKVHFEPLGIYKGKSESLENIPDGATIGVPNDDTNCARALNLLAELGLIEVDTSKGIHVTALDITKNEKNLQIVELEAAQLPTQLPSFDFAVINGNYAIENNLTAKLLATESKTGVSANAYGNIICVKEGNENSEKIQVLVEALKQENVKEYIEREYKDVVVPLL